MQTITAVDKVQGQNYYCAIRQCEDDGHLWYDVGTMSILRDQAELIAFCTDFTIPSWCKANPMVRIALVNITEILF